MIHARVLAGGGAAECGLIAGSLLARDFMAEQFLPGRSALIWGIGFLAVAAALTASAVVGDRVVNILRWSLLAGCGLHAAFAAVLWVFALTEDAAWVGATFASFVAAVYAREVLRLGGFPW